MRALRRAPGEGQITATRCALSSQVVTPEQAEMLARAIASATASRSREWFSFWVWLMALLHQMSRADLLAMLSNP